MSIAELESEVSRLSPDQLRRFSQWFEEFIAARWDKQIAGDAAAGHLDHIARKADEDFEAGRCREM